MHNVLKRFTSLAMVLFLGIVLIACNGEKEYQIPEITNPDKTDNGQVFFETDDFKITNEELFNSVKVNDGLNQLLTMVDSELLKSYLDKVTAQEIADKRILLTYNTDDEEVINDMEEDERNKYITNFEESMYLMGYTQESEYQDYIRLVIAREKYATEYMTSDASAEETWHVGTKAIADYYDQAYSNDIQSIKIKFESEKDALDVMKSYNLISKQGKLLLYTGTTPIDEVPSFALDETNTKELTEAELLEFFVKMYNDVYSGFRDEVAENSTFEELLLEEDLSLNYEDLSSLNKNLAGFIFFTLGNLKDYKADSESDVYYTYKPVKYYAGRDTAYYMILNLSGQEKADLSNFDGTDEELISIIGQDLFDEFKQTIIDINLGGSNFISKRMADLRREHGFIINDPYLAIDYKAIDTDYVESETGHKSVIASYDEVEITADELFDYAINRNLAMYIVHASQVKALMAAHFESVYCIGVENCETDYNKNESTKMLEHINAYDSMKTQFEESMYADYYTFDDYLYLAYGVRNKDEMIYNYYVKSTLQPIYIFDLIKANNYDVLNDLLEMIQPYYDNYFSLDSTHLLIYVDRDENGNPDNYKDFYEELTDKTTFDNLLTDLENSIRDYLEVEDNSFTTLVEEYKDAKRNDATWGEFKSAGIYILTEDLSSKSSLTYATTINQYEDSFVVRLQELYNEYKLEANLDLEFILDDELLETSYGVHLIRVEKGDDFDMPSAKYEMAYGEDNKPSFTVGVENELDQISFEQLRLYAMYRFSVLSFGNIELEDLYGFTRPEIPSGVLDALKEFSGKFHDALYVVGYMNIGIINQLLDGNMNESMLDIYDGQEADLMKELQDISDIYYRQIFLELDVR